MRNPLRGSVAVIAVFAFAGCGESSLELVEESAYVDHDLGELTSGLQVGGATGCDTSIVKALTEQLVVELRCITPNAMVNFSGPHVSLSAGTQPYLAPAAADALRRAVPAGEVVDITSAYRSVAQQYLLYTWWQQNKCSIQSAAVPGTSNHQSGRALDIPKYTRWQKPLGAQGWTWFGKNDKVHFDFFGAPDQGGASVLAFQRLWNKNNPSAPLAETGVWNAETDAAMAQSPAEGFPISGC